MNHVCPDCGVLIPKAAYGCTRLHTDCYHVKSGGWSMRTEDGDEAVEAVAKCLAEHSAESSCVSDFWADGLRLVLLAEKDREPGKTGRAGLIRGDGSEITVAHRRPLAT